MSKPTIKRLTLEDVVPDPQNARRRTEKSAETLVNSLRAVGAGRSIVLDENRTILAGNGTVDAAAEVGMEDLHVIESDGTTLIAVQRAGLTDEQKTHLALADNLASEQSAWDEGEIGRLHEMGLTKGIFTEVEVNDLLLGANHALAAMQADTLPIAETMTNAGSLEYVRVQHDRVPITDQEAQDLTAAIEDHQERFGNLKGFIARRLGLEVEADE